MRDVAVLRFLLAAVAGSLALAAPAGADWDGAYRRFKEAYREDTGAKQRCEALLALAREDVPEAAEVLLDVWDDLGARAAKQRRALHRTRTKIRDLRARIRDPGTDARRREALEEDVNALAAEEAGHNTRLAAVEIEQAAVLEAIGSLKAPETLAWLADKGLARAEAGVLLRAVAERVATGDAGVGALLAALERVRGADEAIPLLQAYALRGGEVGDRLPALLRHLKDRDWAVRVAAAHALARAAEPGGVGPLVRQLQRETRRSRAASEMARALTVLTGAKLGEEPEHWLQWWRANEADVLAGRFVLGQGKPPAPKADQGHFYGIPQVADRIVYVLDASGSMEVSMTNPKWVDGGAVSAPRGESSRWEAAVGELLKATRRLRPGARYAVLLYASHVTPVHDELVEASAETHAALEQALTREGPGGPTNIYEALDYALRMANVHPDQARKESKADAIYLISDGSPTDAQGESENPERTLQAVREWNAHLRVTIHTIGIGRQHNAGFLRQLAEENGGDYWPVVPEKK